MNAAQWQAVLAGAALIVAGGGAVMTQNARLSRLEAQVEQLREDTGEDRRTFAVEMVKLITAVARLEGRFEVPSMATDARGAR